MDLIDVEYTGPGNEVFTDLHWAPKTGEVLSVPPALVLDGDGGLPSRLRRVKAKKSAPAEEA